MTDADESIDRITKGLAWRLKLKKSPVPSDNKPWVRDAKAWGTCGVKKPGSSFSCWFSKLTEDQITLNVCIGHKTLKVFVSPRVRFKSIKVSR